jgi:hypothetical protein
MKFAAAILLGLIASVSVADARKAANKKGAK